MVLIGALGASLLAFGLALSVPQKTLTLAFLLVAALPVCATIVRWSLGPRHAAVRGARLVLTDDDRGWLVVRRPLGTALLDGSRLSHPGGQRALADRIVVAHTSGRAERIEALRLLDRVAALDRWERGTPVAGERRHPELSPEQRALLGRHVRDALARDIELLESRQQRPRVIRTGLRPVGLRASA